MRILSVVGTRPQLIKAAALTPVLRDHHDEVLVDTGQHYDGPDVRVVEPLGYRSSLALQLHAAAVLTDSGGIQRESGWLGVPCLVLRSSTEWVELLAASNGRMALVGLDADRAVRELDKWAPVESGPTLAAARVNDIAIAPSGAADAIAARLSVDHGPEGTLAVAGTPVQNVPITNHG